VAAIVVAWRGRLTRRWGARMSDSILAIDFGTAWTSASVVGAEGLPTRVQAPHARDGGVSAAWPSAVHIGADRRVSVGNAAERARRTDPEHYHAGFRRDLHEESDESAQLTALFLEALREQAQVIETKGPISRAVITVPSGRGGPSDLARRRILTAAEQAGFVDRVDLVDEAFAAALQPPDDGAFAPGEVVMVYSLGAGYFDAVLVRYRDRGQLPEVLGSAPALEGCSGRDIDRAMERFLRNGLALPDGAEDAAGFEQACISIKHDISGMDRGQSVTERLGDGRSITLSVDDFIEHCAGPLIDRTVKHCEQLLDASGAREQLKAILLVGAGTYLRIVDDRLWGTTFPAVPHRRSQARQDAALHGAELFAARAAERVSHALRWEEGERPLRWVLPGGEAELQRWHVRPGARFESGALLAEVRLDDGSVLGLRATENGRVLRMHASPGDRVHEGQWLLSTVLPFRPWSLGLPPLVGTPAVLPEAGALAVCSEAGRVYALVAATGERRWHRDLPGNYDLAGGHLPGTPLFGPVAAPGRLLIATDFGRLHALDPATGQDCWDPYPCGEPIVTPPAVGHGHVVLATRDGRLHLVRTQDGSPAATPVSMPGPVHSVSAPVAGRVYVRLADNSLFAYDPRSGVRKLSDQLACGQPLGVPDGVVSCFLDGTVRLIDGDTGSTRWRRPYEEQQEGTAAGRRRARGFLPRPQPPLLISADSNGGRPAVLLRTAPGWLLSLDLATGADLLRAELAPGTRVRDLQSRGDVLFAATANELFTYARDPKSLPPGSIWRLDFKRLGGLRTVVAVTDEAVYAVVGDGMLYALPVHEPARPYRPLGQLTLR
jgi:outer membrane protein assembly factor BamB